MDIVFMGTPDFSVSILEALVEAGYNVKAVVTQEDKPKGRGRKLQPPPVKEAAVKHGIHVYQPVKIRADEAFFEELKNLNPDVIVVAAYGQILPRRILKLPRYGCINVHASLLPRLRGASPIQTAVINGDRTAGVTTMVMDEGIDTGDMLEKSEIAVDERETAGSLHDKLSELGAKLIITTLAGVEAGTVTPVKQDESLATHTVMLNKKMGKINFQAAAEEIERLVRGLNPWPSAYTIFRGKMLKIWEAYVIDSDAQENQLHSEDARPGTIVGTGGGCIAVQTGRGLLAVTMLQLEGKGKMMTEDFLRGYKVEISERLGDD